jgi:hypothetical protein
MLRPSVAACQRFGVLLARSASPSLLQQRVSTMVHRSTWWSVVTRQYYAAVPLPQQRRLMTTQTSTPRPPTAAQDENNSSNNDAAATDQTNTTTDNMSQHTTSKANIPPPPPMPTGSVTLASIVDVERLRQQEPETIERIWLAYHQLRHHFLSAVVPLDTFKTISARTTETYVIQRGRERERERARAR